MTRIIQRIPKRENEEIRVIAVEYRGLRAVDVRLFYRVNDGEYLPTRKGFVVPRELVKELIKALRKA